MPTFQFTSPDGKDYEVDGPEGSTPEQAFQILQQQIGPAAKRLTGGAADVKTGAAAIPTGAGDRSGPASTRAAMQPKPKPDWFDSFMQRAGAAMGASPAVAMFGDELKGLVGKAETGLSLATMVPAAVGGAGRMAGNAIDTGLGLARGEDVSKRPSAEEAFTAGAAPWVYQPRSRAGQERTEAAGEWMGANLPAIMAGPLGVVGAGQSGASRGAKSAAQPGAVRQGASLAADVITPSITPEMASLVGKASKFGIDVRPDQVVKNKLAKMGGELSTHVPLSGAKTASNQEAFNVALIKQIDPESTATKLTDVEYAKAMDKAGDKIGSIAEQAKVPLDDTLTRGLIDHLKTVATETPEVRGVNAAWVKKIVDAAEDGKSIPGTALRKLDSQLGRQLRTTPDGDLRRTLIDVHDIMMDGLERNLLPESMATFKDARRQYAIGKAIEPVIAKTIDGDFPAPQLMGRLTATNAGKRFMAMGKGGEVGDLAKVGQLLKEPASSGTAERRFVYGAAGLGGTGYLEPHAAAAAYAAANLYNRAGPALTRRMAERQALPTPPTPPPPAPPLPPSEPGLSLGFAPRQPGPQPLAPLGDLTPNWETLLGAAPGRADVALDAASLYRALGEPQVTTGTRPTRAKPQQPLVPGRPDLPDSMIAGPRVQHGRDGVYSPVGADEATGAAMQTREAKLARTAQKPRIRANNASGQTEISTEFVNRREAEAKAGQYRVRIDKYGNEQQITDPDAKAGKGEIIMQRGIGSDPNDWSVLSQGDGVGKSAIARAREALKKWKPRGQE